MQRQIEQPRSRLASGHSAVSIRTEYSAPSPHTISFWPDLRVDVVECAVRHRRAPPGWLSLARRHIPPELVVHRSGLRYHSPALTALDLCATVGGDAIDQALRTRARPRHLHQAMELTASRVGNRTRRQLLLDSLDEPWSQAERSFHRLLRKAGIPDGVRNQPVLLNGSTSTPTCCFASSG